MQPLTAPKTQPYVTASASPPARGSQRPHFDFELNPVPEDFSLDRGFYAKLPEIADFGEVVRHDAYHNVPASWHVVLTDVKGSTRAIEAGRYRDVNAVGVATIIALRNALPDVDLPYLFGGDGATALVPGDALEAVDTCLRGVRSASTELFDLELRVGRVPVAELLAAGHQVRVGRFALSKHIRLAMFSGSGFQAAEKWVKNPEQAERYSVPNEGESYASFDGFECRWQPLQNRRGEIVSMIVVALPQAGQTPEQTYGETLARLEQELKQRSPCPVSRGRMRSTGWLGDYSIEARLVARERSGFRFTSAYSHARRRTAIGRLLRAVGARGGSFDGRTYLDDFVANADFRKFDEALRMVLDLEPAETEAMLRWLDQQYAARRLVYGVHRAPQALVTCMVKNYSGDHVHFVDGCDGGYALAAKQLKARLQQL